MKKRLLSVLAIGLTLGGCVGPTISPGWTLTERTPVLRSDSPGAAGIRIEETRALTPGYRATVGNSCHPSLAAETGQAVFRPGVGAHLRLGFWSTSTNRAREAVFLPLNLEMDLVLRRIGEGGQLNSAERVVLDTSLATSRLRPSDENELPALAQEGADAVANNEVPLWNALVETLCVSIISERDSTPARPLLRVEADLSRLCEAISDARQQQAFARRFVDAVYGTCHLGGAQGAGDPRLQTAAAHPGHRIRRLVGGNERDPTQELLGSTSAVAAGAGYRMEGDFYAASQNVTVGATGEIRLQSPQFGDRGTEHWTLQDWEESRICRDGRPGATEPWISSVNIDGYSFAIRRRGEGPATHEIRRIFGPDGYRFEVAQRPNGTGTQSLEASDLALLHPADVSFTNWRVERRGRRLWSRPYCARR